MKPVSTFCCTPRLVVDLACEARNKQKKPIYLTNHEILDKPMVILETYKLSTMQRYKGRQYNPPCTTMNVFFPLKYGGLPPKGGSSLGERLLVLLAYGKNLLSLCGNKGVWYKRLYQISSLLLVVETNCIYFVSVNNYTKIVHYPTILHLDINPSKKRGLVGCRVSDYQGIMNLWSNLQQCLNHLCSSPSPTWWSNIINFVVVVSYNPATLWWRI